MKRIVLVLLLVTGIFQITMAQKMYTKNGMVSFFSSTPMEDIKASNNQVLCALNSQTGELQFSLLNKGFHFTKALMEEHFNDSYIESNKYPKSTFKGTVADIAKINFAKDGTYPVSVSGSLTIHGVTKAISAAGNIIVKDGKPTASSKFTIKPADYGITIPGSVKNNISETIEITVNCVLDQKM